MADANEERWFAKLSVASFFFFFFFSWLGYFTSLGAKYRGNSVTGRPVYLLHTRIVPLSGNIGISFWASRWASLHCYMIVVRWYLLLVRYSIWSHIFEYIRDTTVSTCAVKKTTILFFFLFKKGKQKKKKTHRTFLIFWGSIRSNVARPTIIPPRCAKSIDYKLQYQYIWWCIFSLQILHE